MPVALLMGDKVIYGNLTLQYFNTVSSKSLIFTDIWIKEILPLKARPGLLSKITVKFFHKFHKILINF